MGITVSKVATWWTADTAIKSVAARASGPYRYADPSGVADCLCRGLKLAQAAEDPYQPRPLSPSDQRIVDRAQALLLQRSNAITDPSEAMAIWSQVPGLDLETRDYAQDLQMLSSDTQFVRPHEFIALLPPAIGRLADLRKLDLRFTGLFRIGAVTTLPSALDCCRALSELVLSEDSLEFIDLLDPRRLNAHGQKLLRALPVVQRGRFERGELRIWAAPGVFGAGVNARCTLWLDLEARNLSMI